jgi:hypothetical protein
MRRFAVDQCFGRFFGCGYTNLMCISLERMAPVIVSFSPRSKMKVIYQSHNFDICILPLPSGILPAAHSTKQLQPSVDPD